MIYFLNLFITIYFIIVAITLVKAYLEYLKVKNDNTKTHRIEIYIPLPHDVIIGIYTVIRNAIMK